MGNDKCVICRSAAGQMVPVAGFVGISCSQCGDYSINEQLVQDLAKARRTFNVVRAQTWLAISRKSGVIPTITALDVSIHGLVNDG
ncbi:hypothetical protein ACX3YG_14475 [Pseudomonas wadenswilerensis]